MNPNKTTLRALLDDVLLPSCGESHGPDRAQVLALLRSERVRRRRWRASAAVAALAALMLSFLLWKSPSRTAPSPVAATIRQPAPLVIEHVNDDQLITLLHGTPSALMEWPNGDRTLLVLKR